MSDETEYEPLHLPRRATAKKLVARPEPWDSTVEGAELLDSMTGELQRYLSMSDMTPETVALWCLHTFVYELFWCTPYLSIQSPEPGCGKSTLLTAVKRLSCAPIIASNISPAALFRIVDVEHPTLILDECDQVLNGKNGDKISIINSGHSKDSPVVYRTVGDNYEPKSFSTFCPKAMASIGTLPSTIQSRSIVVHMRRQRRGETTEQFREDLPGEFHVLARMAERWAEDNRASLEPPHNPTLPPQLIPRSQDNWRPLVSIANLVGGHWPKTALEAAVELSGAMDTDDDLKSVLLTDIKAIFADREVEYMTPTDMVDALKEIEAGPWMEYSYGKPLTTNKLGRLLGPYGIKASPGRWGGNQTKRYYLKEQFLEAFERYIPD